MSRLFAQDRGRFGGSLLWPNVRRTVVEGEIATPEPDVDLDATPYLGCHILHSQWPPQDYSLFKPLLIYVDVDQAPDLPALIGLSPDEKLATIPNRPGKSWVVLGLARICASSTNADGYAYQMAEKYSASSAREWTRKMAKERPSEIEQRIKADAERVQKAREEFYRKQREELQAKEARERAELARAPVSPSRLRELEQKVADLEAQQRKETEERARALEAKLAELSKTSETK